MITATQSKSTPRERPALGNVQAVCTTVRDLGLQRESGKFGEKVSHKIVIVWEINQTITSGEFVGKRMVQSKKYTLSMYEKASLRKDLESWRGKKWADEKEACAFDLEKLIGVNCLLNLQASTDGQYINIAGISPIMAGMQKMTPELAPDHVYKWIDDLASKAVSEDSIPQKTFPDTELTINAEIIALMKKTEAKELSDELVDTGFAPKITSATEKDVITLKDDEDPFEFGK